MKTSQLHLVDISTTQQPLKLLRLKQVQAKTGLCKSQIYLLQKQERFPAAVRLNGGRVGRGSVAWLDHEVEAWIESRVRASRDNAGGAS